MVLMPGDINSFRGVATPPLLDLKGKQGEVAVVLPSGMAAGPVDTALERPLAGALTGCPEGSRQSPLLSPSNIPPARPQRCRRRRGGRPAWF